MSNLTGLPPIDEPIRRTRPLTGEEAVSHTGSPLLVLGGPGTGKTRFVEERYLHLASAGGVEPHRILVLCSSRSYSVRARDRLVRRLSQEATVEVPVYTWHALAYHLVTRYYPVLGFSEPPVLLTAPEQWGAVRELLDAEDPGRWPHWGDRLRERAFADEVADFCLRVEQNLHSAESLAALVAQKPEWSEVAAFVNVYREHLKARSRMDYAQLSASAGRLLGEDPGVAAALRERFPHVMVDDGQDMGPVHLALLKHLQTDNLVVAADPDCGIESYRGAQPDWVHGFAGHFGPHETVVLEENCRIGAPLAPALGHLIQFNDDRATHRPTVPAGHTTEFDCRQYMSTVEEVESIARELRRLHVLDKMAWGDMAVLISQPRFLLTPLQRALEQCQVPYQPLQGDRPLALEPVVKCFLDLVRVCLGEGPPRLLPDLLTSPLIGLDYTTRRGFEREAWRTRQTLEEVLAEAPEAAELSRLAGLVRKHGDQADECFWQVYSNSSYYRGLEERALADPQDPANAAIDALVAFSHGLERFVERRRGTGSIGEYLNEAARADFGADSWLAPSAARAEGVAISTFHGAKGREWKVVVVAGCLDAWIPKGHRAQGLFDPYLLQMPDAVNRELAAIAEDRRTFYVAASRARQRVIFTIASPGGRSRPSRFLIELAGQGPVPASPGELPPLNPAEMAAGLRRRLATRDTSQGALAAAVVALAEIPGVDPAGWYGHLDWTRGEQRLVEGELRTSYSRLSVFENCGLQYVLQSVLGLDPASNYSMKFGTWIHALFQAWHEGKIADPGTLQREYENLFDATIFPNTTISRQFHRDGLKMLEVFFKHEAVAGPNVLSEHSFSFPYEGAVLRGRIDRMDRKNKGQALTLTDYKTAKWAPSFREAQSSLQLAIYHLAAKMDPELKALGEPLLARLVYPGAYMRDGSHTVLNQNAEEAEKVIEKLPGIIASVRDEDFRPNPHAECHFCKMRPLCPLYADGREVRA